MFIKYTLLKYTMEQKTTMKISKEFKLKLQHYKKTLGCKSLEEVVEKILKIVPVDDAKFHIPEKQNGNNKQDKNSVEEIQDAKVS